MARQEDEMNQKLEKLKETEEKLEKLETDKKGLEEKNVVLQRVRMSAKHCVLHI